MFSDAVVEEVVEGWDEEERVEDEFDYGDDAVGW